MNPLRAFRTHQDNSKIAARIETISFHDLSSEEVIAEVAYSDISYKDALSLDEWQTAFEGYPKGGDTARTVSKLTQ